MACTSKYHRRAAKLLKYASRLLSSNGITPPHFLAVLDNLSIGYIGRNLIHLSLLGAVASLKVPQDSADWRPGGTWIITSTDEDGYSVWEYQPPST